MGNVSLGLIILVSNHCFLGSTCKVALEIDSSGWATGWLEGERGNLKNFDILVKGTLLSSHWNHLIHARKRSLEAPRASDVEEIKVEVLPGDLKHQEDFREIRELHSYL